ncbi:MAG TPA: hypothetical protein VK206_19155 [Anaerolineales bacterium]|nr:hypothetical protein [Anaerolineales bacterium]HLO31535.1 hypothetical protein [Anaerolineales bacterium]
MATKRENQREALLAELEVHKTEYNTLRQEILQLKDAEKQYLNLCLVAIGAGLGLSSYIAKEDLFIILLLFPFVFHILLWEMLNAWRGRNWLYRYLLEVLIPRANYIVNELRNNEEQIQVLRWTGYISTKNFLTLDERVLVFLSPSSHVIPVLAVGVLVIAFLLVSDSYGHILSETEVALIFVNLGMLIFAAIQIIFNNRSDARKAKIANAK